MAIQARKTERAFESNRTANTRLPAASSRSRPDGRTNHILAVATRVIARDGYERASMRTIARDSGVSLAGLYHYLDSKQELLFHIQFRAFSALLTEVQARLFGIEDPVEQLRTMIRTHVQYVADNMASLRVCSHELDSLSGHAYDQVHAVRREYYELVRTIIGRVIEEQAPSSGLDPRIATMSLFGTLNWLYRWYDPGGERSPAGLANQIFAQFIGGIRGPAGAGRRARSRAAPPEVPIEGA